MMNSHAWIMVNKELVAKAIGELYFEQILNPIKDNNEYHLHLPQGISYTFEAQMSLWDHLRVNPLSLKRNGKEVESAGQFFIDSKSKTTMDDIVLANFLEEMNNTLFSDMVLFQKRESATAALVATWNGEKIQTVLNGHPKILLNKGRIGWGDEDLDKFSPESEKSFQLHWIAVSRDLLQGEAASDEILAESLSIDERKALTAKIDMKAFTLIPVHPWQWHKFIHIQFAELIQTGKIISLGLAGDEYTPQISIRTLSNTKHPEKMDIKLPLTILNTSCIRGLPAKTITLGTKISKILSKICEADPILSKTEILQEQAGVALVHPLFSQIKDAPYRYHEYLGAVWRESSQSKIKSDELAIITASLFYQDHQNNSLIGEYIKKSGLTTEDWLKRYFEVVIVPLYHLQLHYGVGMVAHGQNIILKLKNFIPTGMMLKDFQGDLRLNAELPPKGLEHFSVIAHEMTKLPSHYLIHDLITGHFITVLRFISEVMKESDDFSEEKFYGILSDVLLQYTKTQSINEKQDLLAKTFPRVLLNKVRFSIGYSDLAERPLPMVGSDLNSPLARKI